MLNAGSVGMPYEGEPAAYWLLARPGRASCGAPDYDIAAAVERMRASGLPEVDELALRESLIDPIGAAVAARVLEARAGGGLDPAVVGL